MEQAVWIDWRKIEIAPSGAQRIYFGHETCANLLPDIHSAKALAHRCLEAGKAATLVTPFVSDEAFDYAVRLINVLCDILGTLELISSDWGILNTFCGHNRVTPVIGRLLTAQPTDPRIMRLLSAEESLSNTTTGQAGKTAQPVKKMPASAMLKNHFRKLWLDRPHVQQYLMGKGICRAEISFPSQGICVSPISKWSYSLHVSDVIVAVMACCEGNPAGASSSRCAASAECTGNTYQWSHPSFAQPFYRSGNGIYYRPQIKADEQFPSAIDRTVYKIGGR